MADQNLKVTLSAVDKTRQAFASVRNGLGRIGRSVANIRTALIGLGATVALKQFATQIDNLAKASSRLGLTVNQIQTLQFAASQTGASAEELEKGLTRFSRNISEASTGIGTGVRAFEALGIQITKTDGSLKPTNELLNEVSDRLSGIKDPADKVRIAFDLFGRSGVNLVNTLQAGSGELSKLRDEFNAVTLQLTQEDAKAVEEANDLFDKLGRTFISFGQKITSFILPPLSRLAKFLTIGVVLGFANAIEAARNFLNFFVTGYNKIADLTPLDPIEKFGFGKEMEQNLRNIADAFDKTEKQINKVRIPISVTVKGFERLKNVVKETQPELSALQQSFKDVGDRGIKSLEDALVGVIDGTKSAKEAFKDMARSIISDLIRLAIQKQITGPLYGALGSFFTGQANTTTMPAFMAKGGTATGGTPYIVGEKGPELFVPGRTGTVVPNNQLNSGGGVTINQTINVTTGVQQTVRTEIANLMPRIAQASKQAVLESRQRGGSFATAFGG
jgi:hypothetical protein